VLQIEYQLTEKEYLDCNFYTFWQIPEKKPTRIRYYLATSLIPFGGVLAVTYLLTDRLELFTIIVAFIVCTVLFLTTRFRIRSTFDKQAKKMIEQSGGDSFLSKTELTFNENGVYGTTRVSEVKYTWNAFKKKAEVNNCYYLYLNMRQALIVPKRVFLTQSEKEKFEKLILTYFPLQPELETLNK
jgi:hypothetical protein